MSVVANDQYASLQLAEKRKKRQPTESQKILKVKYKISGSRLLCLACQGGEI